ncbi:type II toxin-antitoxin system HicA family toxin [Bacillus altitudinis]|uniref:type II toxin-antitoxin system HicA family toxin n=1 Tax=Bacillus TaxID=1386 RepID=UPI00389AC3C6
MSYREITKILTKHGCYLVREGAGSHKIWFSPITGKKFPIQNHKGKDIPLGTVRKIQKQSGVKLL